MISLFDGCSIDVPFSVDDPFRDNLEAIDFLNNARLSQDDREKLSHGNAERVLGLSSDVVSRSKSNRSFRSSIDAFKANVKSRLGRKALSFLVK